MSKTEPYTEEDKVAYAATLPEGKGQRFNWRHQYDPIRDELEAELVAIAFPDPSLTQQHFTKDADLNSIVKRYGITDGAIPPAAIDPQFFGDFTNAPPDFRAVLDLSRDATNKFMALPAKIRTEFGNDPAIFHDWVTNPANKTEAIEMGLIAKDPPKKDTRPITVQRKAELQEWAAKNSEEAHRLGINKKDPPKKDGSK